MREKFPTESYQKGGLFRFKMEGETLNIFGLKNLEEIKNRPDILAKVRFDITPQMIMEPLFNEKGELKKKDLSGYFFYIETEGERPALMLMKVSKTSAVKSVGIIKELPEDMIKRAMENPVLPPVHGMYAINEEIKEWLKKTLNLPSSA